MGLIKIERTKKKRRYCKTIAALIKNITRQKMGIRRVDRRLVKWKNESKLNYCSLSSSSSAPFTPFVLSSNSSSSSNASASWYCEKKVVRKFEIVYNLSYLLILGATRSPKNQPPDRIWKEQKNSHQILGITFCLRKLHGVHAFAGVPT